MIRQNQIGEPNMQSESRSLKKLKITVDKEISDISRRLDSDNTLTPQNKSVLNLCNDLEEN